MASKCSEDCPNSDANDTCSRECSCTLVKRYLWYVLLYSYINKIGNFYDLTKHLYCNKLLNMFCKNRRKQNSFFLILKEVFVKLGCILSPLLFNLYLNNLPCIYSKTHDLIHLFSQWNKT